ncbi:hypothetical protein Bhyg_03024, partial [Pseudolycoriella hygida]
RYGIPSSKISAVTMDNVSSNDTFMDFLQKHGTEADTHLSKPNNRIRCLPHVLNLAVQDVLAALKVPLNQEEDGYTYLDHLEGDEISKLSIEENDVDEEEEDEDDGEESSRNDPT